MRCVECGFRVQGLFQSYGKDPNNIRLTKCPQCNLFADKYVEFDKVIVFIDMLLLKPQVYRHIIFNRTKYSKYGLNKTVLKLGLLLVLFDIYLKWILIESVRESILPASLKNSNKELLFSYIYLLLICLFGIIQLTLETISSHVFIWIYCYFIGIRKLYDLNRLSMSIIISSYGKFLPILTVIWDYNVSKESFAVNKLLLEYKTWIVTGIVFLTNLQAAQVFIESNIWKSFSAMVFAALGRVCFQLFWKKALDPDIPVSL